MANCYVSYYSQGQIIRAHQIQNF